MSVGLYSHTTRATGTILTAAIYNSDHQNHITNQNPTMTGALSDNLTEHQLVQDPGGLGTEVLGANLAEELEQLRFTIKRITGKAQWYIAPATDLESVGGTIVDLVVTETAAIRGTLTPAQITANQNNYAPAGHADVFCFRLSSDALRNITGLAGGADGRIIALQNVGSNLIQLTNEDAASTAANRFVIGTEGAVDIGAGEGVLFRYDSVSSRWRPLSTADMQSPSFNIPRANAFDFPELTPANPAANIARLYAKDVATVTKLAYRDSAGTETVLEVSLTPAPTLQVFTAGGTWNKPAGISAAIVHVIGGGGGSDAGAGGTSSFGAHCSATGGAGGFGAPGVGSSGDVNTSGGQGCVGLIAEGSLLSGNGAGPFGGGVKGVSGVGNNYGGGGFTSGSGGGTGGGSGGGYSMKRIAAGSLGATETVTVGAGGNGVHDGAPGIVVVEEFYS